MNRAPFICCFCGTMILEQRLLVLSCSLSLGCLYQNLTSFLAKWPWVKIRVANKTHVWYDTQYRNHPFSPSQWKLWLFTFQRSIEVTQFGIVSPIWWKWFQFDSYFVSSGCLKHQLDLFLLGCPKIWTPPKQKNNMFYKKNLNSQGWDWSKP